MTELRRNWLIKFSQQLVNNQLNVFLSSNITLRAAFPACMREKRNERVWRHLKGSRMINICENATLMERNKFIK